MLVLSRKYGERIIVGKDREIVITALRLVDDQIEIGISASPDIPILREELVGHGDGPVRQPVRPGRRPFGAGLLDDREGARGS